MNECSPYEKTGIRLRQLAALLVGRPNAAQILAAVLCGTLLYLTDEQWNECISPEVLEHADKVKL